MRESNPHLQLNSGIEPEFNHVWCCEGNWTLFNSVMSAWRGVEPNFKPTLLVMDDLSGDLKRLVFVFFLYSWSLKKKEKKSVYRESNPELFNGDGRQIAVITEDLKCFCLLVRNVYL